jgi:hypothetical protein
MDTDELRRLGTKRGKLIRELDEVSERIRELAVAALRGGVPVVDVLKDSGYSHAQLRNIARAAGLPPARRGVKAKS